MAARGRHTQGEPRLETGQPQYARLDIRYLAAGSLLGCLCLSQLSKLPSITLAWVGLFVCLLLPIFIRYWHRFVAVSIGFVLLFCYGVITAQGRLDLRLPSAEHGQERLVQGHVASLPELKQSAGGSVQRFLFKTRRGVQKNIRVSWYNSDKHVAYGDCLRLVLRMRVPRGSQNPGGLDYEGWLFREGIAATASVRSADVCSTDSKLLDATAIVGRLRQHISDRIKTGLNGHPMQAFVLGLVLGDRSAITTEQWQVLRRSGVSHLLAISGLHIGLIAGFAFFLISIVWKILPSLSLYLPRMQAAAIAAGTAGLIYSALAGFSLPTQRAVIMLFVWVLAVFFSRQTRPSYLLAIALLLVLLLDPFSVSSAGFWLSFGAVAWIFYVLQARLESPSGWRLWLWLQCVLGLALLPLALFWFGEGSWLAPLANLVMIPLFCLLVPAILFSTALALYGDVGYLLALEICADTLWLIWQGLEWLTHSIPVFSSPATITAASSLLAMVACVWLFAPRGWPVRGLALLLLLPLLISQPHNRPQPGELAVTVLDVGQGLSMVLRTRNHLLVYDAGPAWAGGFDAGAMVLVPYLRHIGAGKVDRYVQSHDDLDHRGGAAAFTQAYNIDDQLGTAAGGPCQRGQQWLWDGVQFSVLHPGVEPGTGNNSSCVLRVQVGDYAMLLTGDIEVEAEQVLFQQQRGRMPADVLLVPHHGSKTSSSIGLLNAVAPSLAIVSAGWRNQWGHPAEQVVRRYQARDIAVLNTAESGAIQFKLNAQSGLGAIEAYRESHSRFWHAD